MIDIELGINDSLYEDRQRVYHSLTKDIKILEDKKTDINKDKNVLNKNIDELKQLYKNVSNSDKAIIKRELQKNMSGGYMNIYEVNKKAYHNLLLVK